MVAGLWSCAYSLGEVLGPAIGGVLVQQCGFPLSVTIIAVLNLITAAFGFVYFSRRKLKAKRNLKFDVNDKSISKNGKTNSVFIVETASDIK